MVFGRENIDGLEHWNNLFYYLPLFPLNLLLINFKSIKTILRAFEFIIIIIKIEFYANSIFKHFLAK